MSQKRVYPNFLIIKKIIIIIVIMMIKIIIQTMDWNVGAVYLVPCCFYAIMLSILTYCLFFLKYVFTISIIMIITIIIIMIIMSSPATSLYYRQEERVEDPHPQCCYNLSC